jgi:hypothetical protein
MGGQSWPELELHMADHGRACWRRERGEGEGERGSGWGRHGGAWGGAATGGGDSVLAAPCDCSLFGPCACVRKKAWKEKREKKRKEGKEEKETKKWGKF